MSDKHKFIVGVECALIKEDKCLIIQRPPNGHAGGLYAFPGGGVELKDGAHNILVNGAKREVLEEVGLKLLDPIHYVTSDNFILQDGTQVIHTVFFSTLEKTKIAVTPHEREVPYWAWMTKTEIEQSELSPVWLKQYVEKISRKIGGF